MHRSTAEVLCALALHPLDTTALVDHLDRTHETIEQNLSSLVEDDLIKSLADGRWTIESSLTYDAVGLNRVIPQNYRVTFEERVTSTNELAKELSVSEDESRHLVIAREQTAGRGRYERQWSSPPGGIWASIIDSRHRPPTEAWFDQLAMSVAVTDVNNTLGVPTGVKWPNDVVTTADEKLAGVLAESTISSGHIVESICGVGLNVNIGPEALPPGATSLQILAGEVCIPAIVPYLITSYEDRREDRASTLDVWRTRSLTLDRTVIVDTDVGEIIGAATHLSEEGELVISTDDGQQRISPEQCRRLRYPT